MTDEIKYIFIFISSVLISSMSQILLKQSANTTYSSKLKEYLNCKVILAYILFFVSTIITIIAYKHIPLSLGPVLESFGYIFVSILGFIFLHEKIGIRKLIGMLVVLIGVSVFYI